MVARSMPISTYHACGFAAAERLTEQPASRFSPGGDTAASVRLDKTVLSLSYGQMLPSSTRHSLKFCQRSPNAPALRLCEIAKLARETEGPLPPKRGRSSRCLDMQ